MILAHHSRIRSFLILPVLLGCCGCLGPAVPVRVSTENKDLSGSKRDLDFSFLRAGSTSRGDVSTKLASIDTGATAPQFFWGRWESSRWATTPIVAPYAGSREWAPENILIYFDRSNLVQSWRVVRDKELLQELERMRVLDQQLDLSAPLRISAKLRYWEPKATAELILAADYFEYSGSNRSFKTERGNLKAITMSSEVLPNSDRFDKAGRPQPDPTHVWVKLKLVKRTAKVNSVTLGVDPTSMCS